MAKTNSRRNFIRKYFLAGTAIFGGGLIFTRCNSKKQEDNGQEELTSCSDLSGVSESEIAKREGFGYVEKTPIPENRCDNCALYIPPEGDEKCGECVLFKGPVYSEAYCTYWAPQTS